MAAIKRKDIENNFKWFVDAIGGKMASSWNDIGGYAINHNSTYGGYQIVQISNASGGQHEPFGSMRRKGQDFVDTLHFAVRAVEEAKRNKKR